MVLLDIRRWGGLGGWREKGQFRFWGGGELFFKVTKSLWGRKPVFASPVTTRRRFAADASEVPSALHDLQRIRTIRHAKRLGALQPSQCDFRRRRLPGFPVRFAPDIGVPAQVVRRLRVQRWAAVVANARRGAAHGWMTAMI